MATPNTVRVAVTQHEPIWLDLQGTVDKTCKIIKEAAEAGAKIVAFPECWIPGYPAWIWTRPVDFDLGVKYVQNSLTVPSAELSQICASAAENSIAVSLGFSERSGESIYISQALISATGILQTTRRKMKPTHMERTIFGDATGGQCLTPVVPVSEVGKVGSLSCWEHIQPLLKYYTFTQGEQIHVAAWPVLDAFVDGSPGFYSMTTEGCRTVSQVYAIESQSFVLHCTTLLRDAGIKAMGTAGSPLMGTANEGSSAVIGPDGRVLAQTKTGGEELLVVDLDLNLVVKTMTFADAGGHCKCTPSDYADASVKEEALMRNADSRPDMLWLGADPTDKPIIRVETK